MAVNMIGDEGAKALSEMLKVNTTLTKLYLWSMEERKRKGEGKKYEYQVMISEMKVQKHCVKC